MNWRHIANKAGFRTITDLAKALGISTPSIVQWKKIPAERAVQIEQVSGGRVTRRELRPDLYEDAQ